VAEAAASPNHRRRLRNILLSFLATLIFAAILLVSAGSLAWFWGWMVIGVMLAANMAGVLILDPGLMDERTGLKSGHKRWDVPLATLVGRLGPLAMSITSGLDFRFGWSEPFPTWLAVLGLVLLAFGNVLALWAMRENQFFSSVIRIQEERGHHVIVTGPYRMVRHPGYLGSAVVLLAFPFALTSYWALMPTAATILISVVRTALEDSTLRKELEGYPQYAQMVRYRLVPGVW